MTNENQSNESKLTTQPQKPGNQPHDSEVAIPLLRLELLSPAEYPPAPTSSGSYPSALYDSEQATVSALQAVEDLGKHDKSAPAASLNVSQLERSNKPVPSKITFASILQKAKNFGRNKNIGTLSTNSDGGVHVPFEPTFANCMAQPVQSVNVVSNPNFINIWAQSTGTSYCEFHGLEHMEEYVSLSAAHSSSAQDPECICHPGTRHIVLKQITNWIDNPSSPERIFWLRGPAGAGKSAIAQTIAYSYHQKQVAATFFFFRSDPSRNNGNRLFTTLAWQLALLIPAIKEHIARSLERRPDLPRTDIETQFEELIVRPFLALKEMPAHLLSPVVIIDGIDECRDEWLQRRFLKVIGNAIEGDRVPLRFLICSRPEAHIQEVIDRFSEPKLIVDLATLDDANRDIEKYLRYEFSRIAIEQDLDPSTWPGDQRIQQFVYKSSGNFVYAANVIRYADDEYNSAIRQLDIILGLKPQSSKSPFAELDALYLEILERQSDRDFIITFLAVLVARFSLDSNDYEMHEDFHLDDAMLMKVSDTELHRKLRGMRSLFKLEPRIDLYHRSFFDFLQDSSRSLQFYTSKEKAQRQYLDLITASIVRFTSKIIDQPTYHQDGHFAPEFGELIKANSQALKLQLEEWEEVLRPLLDILGNLLHPSKIELLKRGYCKQCRVFQITHAMLMHLKSLRETAYHVPWKVDAIEEYLMSLDAIMGIKRNVDDAFHAIEKYFRDEFARIASEQDLDSTTWPGDEKFQQVVYNSSGQFIYAATVIRYVGDEDKSAISQLDIILGLNPQSTTSPFAKLDALYVEILEQHPDLDFLMTFLALFVARLSIAHNTNENSDSLHLDDVMLLNVSEGELHTKLRGMRFVFKFEPHIDIYHRSFLDFLQDSSRSGRFYTSKENAQRRYLELIRDFIVRFASEIIRQPTYHQGGHFAPEFGKLIKGNSQAIELQLQQWEDILRPLLDILGDLLHPSKIELLKRGYCKQCQFFQITHDVLTHLICLRETANHVPWNVDVEEYLMSLDAIMGVKRHVDLQFGRNIFGPAVIVGFLMAVLAHWR